MTCKECGGDVVKTFVGPTVKYVHAVKGIDHGPLPTEAPGSRSEVDTAPPCGLPPATARRPRPTALELPEGLRP